MKFTYQFKSALPASQIAQNIADNIDISLFEKCKNMFNRSNKKLPDKEASAKELLAKELLGESYGEVNGLHFSIMCIGWYKHNFSIEGEICPSGAGSEVYITVDNPSVLSPFAVGIIWAVLAIILCIIAFGYSIPNDISKIVFLAASLFSWVYFAMQQRIKKVKAFFRIMADIPDES